MSEFLPKIIRYIEARESEAGRLWRLVNDMDAAIKTAGFVLRNTDSGPNLVRS